MTWRHSGSRTTLRPFSKMTKVTMCHKDTMVTLVIFGLILHKNAHFKNRIDLIDLLSLALSVAFSHTICLTFCCTHIMISINYFISFYYSFSISNI